MSEIFKRGDTVELPSGGTAMTVESLEDVQGMTMVSVVWFVGSTPKQRKFPADMLRVTTRPPTLEELVVASYERKEK
jgi:uncharacterized protein YodC (DUF2158 family)